MTRPPQIQVESLVENWAIGKVQTSMNSGSQSDLRILSAPLCHAVANFISRVLPGPARGPPPPPHLLAAAAAAGSSQHLQAA